MSRMEVNGLFAEINTPAALTGAGINGLPPYDRRQAYVVDEYPSCPESWMHGSAKASSYFVPVKAGRGMWFDFVPNQHNPYHVAIVVSVQGINPLTGKKVTALNLEQYRDKCPVHETEFRQDRYCEKCGYCWPAQNYIASTTGLHMWIDGFRNEKGEVVQYIITEDEARGVAAQVLGADRVWAIGFAFYLSKEPKPKQPSVLRSSGFSAPGSSVMSFGGSMGLVGSDSAEYGCDMADMAMDDTLGAVADSGFDNETPTASIMCCSPSSHTAEPADMSKSIPISSTKHSLRSRGIIGSSASAMKSVKKLEIAAGARISQDHGIDQNPIEFWQPEPAGLIYCNYIDEDRCAEIIAAGKRQDKANGPLAGLKVGN